MKYKIWKLMNFTTYSIHVSENDKTRWTVFSEKGAIFVKTKKGWSQILPIWLLIFWEDFKKLSQIARIEIVWWTVYKNPGKSPYN